MIKSEDLCFAIKIISLQLEEQHERFQKEVKAFEILGNSHANIVKLLEHELVSNDKIREGLLLFPFYPNGTIQDRIDQEVEKYKFPKIPLKLIFKWYDGICNGLITFHKHNLAFRDLKPANVLIGPEGQAVLTDLGSVSPSSIIISSHADALKLSDECAELVSAPFRPPELFDVLNGSTINERTDVWSLGCTLYAMRYGESPFDGSATSANARKPPFPEKKIKLNEFILSHFKIISERPSVDEQKVRFNEILTDCMQE